MEWMYPYLTPHGLIMKVNNKKTPITNKMIKDDTEFWDWYCERLLNDDRFIRDICARKSFSKLRGSIASLYCRRGKAKGGICLSSGDRTLRPEPGIQLPHGRIARPRKPLR